MPSDTRETEGAHGTQDTSTSTANLSDTGISAMQGVSDSDAVQERGAVQALREMDDIQPETWQGLEHTERMTALQNVETEMSAIQERTTADVSGFKGEQHEYGGYDPDTNQIYVNEYHVDNGSVRENVDTIVHEGRHAYQHHAVENPGYHDNPAEVQAWEDNFDNYRDADTYGQEIYQNQPIEADAWTYADEITDGVYEE